MANYMELIKKISKEKSLYYLFCASFFLIPMGTSPFTIMGSLTIVFWLFSGSFIKSGYQYLKAVWFLPLIAILGITWLGLLWSYDPTGLGIKYAEKTHYWLYALAVSSIGLSMYPPENLMMAFLYGLAINSFIGFMQFFDLVPEFSEWGNNTGFYGGYNTLSILIILGILISSYFLRTLKEKGIKWVIIYGALMLIYFLHLMILPGRGGYLTFIILSPLILYNILYGKKIIYIFLTYFIAIGILFSSPIVRDRAGQAVERIKIQLKEEPEIATGKKYSRYMDRIYMWRWAVEIFLKHPVIGAGTGGYRQAVLDSGGDQGVDHPHNNILYVASSFGILGLIIYGWFFYILLSSGWRHRDSSTGFFILSSSLVILVGGLTDTHILDAGGASLLALTTGLVSALPKAQEKHHHEGHGDHEDI